MSDCAETARQLTRFLDRELSPQEIHEVQGHLDACPDCRTCYELQAELKRLVRRECASEDAPARLRNWVRQLLVERPARKT